MQITQERLKEILHYDPETGVFTWLEQISKKSKPGTVAGYYSSYGYRGITILNQQHRAHRLAFLYMEGDLPPSHVDHINRVRDDNRWCNLRHATPSINASNRVNSTNFVGVSWSKTVSRWIVHKYINKKNHHLGYFKTHLAACCARHSYDQLN